MKNVIFTTVPTGFLQSATVLDGQLHAIVEDTENHVEAIYEAKWDGKKPYVEVLKGDLTMPKMAYMGWPMEDKAAYEARVLKDAPLVTSK